VRLAPEHLARDAHAAGQRQRDVEEQYVGLSLIHECVGVLRLARLAHELEVGLRREQRAQPFAEQTMIIHETQFDRHTRSAYTLVGKVQYNVARVMCNIP